MYISIYGTVKLFIGFTLKMRLIIDSGTRVSVWRDRCQIMRENRVHTGTICVFCRIFRAEEEASVVFEGGLKPTFATVAGRPVRIWCVLQ